MFELDTLRLIKKTFKRFLSLTLIVMIGAGFMMGLLSTAIVMRQSADEYSDEYNVEDMMIYSSYGFCTEDYEKLSNLDYVDTVFASKEIDCQAIDKHEGVTVSRVTELTRKNDNFYISEGRMPEKADECLVITGTMRSSLSVGDTLTLNYGDNDINDYLTVSHYTVAGIAKSPQYMSRLLGASNYKNEELVIKQTPFSEIQKSNSKNIKRVGVEEIVEINNLIGKKKQCRKSIQLSKVQWDSERVFCMKTLKELKKENADEKGKI